MSDRKLLEAAATAAGIFLTPERFAQESTSEWEPAWTPFYDERKKCMTGYRTWYGSDGVEIGGWEPFDWNPLADDGEALRLAVLLHIDFRTYVATVRTWVGDPIAQRVLASVEELCGDDPLAATRRAIVRAAAALAPVKV